MIAPSRFASLAAPRRWVALAMLLAAGACFWRDSGLVDTTALEQDAAGPRLRATIIGDSGDARVAPAREAIAYWNREFLRLGRRTHFDSATIRADSIPDSMLRAAMEEVGFGGGPATNRLLGALANDSAEIAVVLSHTDLISYSVRWREGSRGVAVIRRSDVPPLSLPNTVRNVIAHEIGHAIGLDHNRDSTTLMCGRPAPCRPVVFASDSARFFPLTRDDDKRLRERWP